MTLGHEVAGEVIAAAPDVKGYPAGRRVVVTPRVACGKCYYCLKGQPQYCENHVSFGGALQGGFAEYMLIPGRAVEYGSLIAFNDSTDFEEASLAESLSCCIRAQNFAELKAGDTVAVIGGGPMGVLHTRLALIRGAAKIILVDRNIRRLTANYLDSVNKLIDAANTNVKKSILSETGGRGADVVIIACSSREAQQESPGYTNYGGRISFFAGLNPGEQPTQIDANTLHYREIKISGTHGSTPTEMREALELIKTKKVKVADLITATFPLEKTPEAFRAAEAKSGMKIVVCP